MPDCYVYKTDWEANKDGIQEATRESALENNPGMHIASETVTCPVSGVDDPEVALVRIVMEPDET